MILESTAFWWISTSFLSSLLPQTHQALLALTAVCLFLGPYQIISHCWPAALPTCPEGPLRQKKLHCISLFNLPHSRTNRASLFGPGSGFSKLFYIEWTNEGRMEEIPAIVSAWCMGSGCTAFTVNTQVRDVKPTLVHSAVSYKLQKEILTLSLFFLNHCP